jgi:hypothetical protein
MQNLEGDDTAKCNVTGAVNGRLPACGDLTQNLVAAYALLRHLASSEHPWEGNAGLCPTPAVPLLTEEYISTQIGACHSIDKNLMGSCRKTLPKALTSG